jgi:uncharacterized protein YyaL (SSP411 family)
MTNHLAGSNSPYLLQHAENPVDWYPWGEAALSRARTENKPIFLSIGYAACHWCHVMAHESFEDASVAALLNDDFISIKVDREERPDLDGIYMQATTALTGSGGWPMSVFLTPDLEPFYAGTYFPPTPRHGLPSFTDLVRAISRLWEESPDKAARQGQKLLSVMRSSTPLADDGTMSQQALDEASAELVRSRDTVHGGWGNAPKFPQPMAIEFLLRRSIRSDQSEAGLNAAVQALQAMSRGGMHDVVGGGFARYSTDAAWHVPHFEKMLYDNAQLALAYLHAWQLTHRQAFRSVAERTLAFIEREMTGPDGGFYSSIDADSEGEEGRFYVWTRTEIQSALDDSSLFEVADAAYHLRDGGTWEGKIVLQRALDDETLGARLKLSPSEVHTALQDIHERLLRVRSARARPVTDDKVLASWNGLALRTFAQAAAIAGTGDSDGHYLQVATRNAAFLLQTLAPKGKLAHTWRGGRAGGAVFLEDFGSLTLGLIDLYQVTFDNQWILAAQRLLDEVLERFKDPSGGFFDTPADGEALPVRPKDLQDNAVPCGNSLVCEALLKMASLTGSSTYLDAAEAGLRQAGGLPAKHPLAFGQWLNVADLAASSALQLAILYPPASTAAELLAVARSAYRPNLVVSASLYPPPDDAPELVKHRPPKDNLPTAFICRGFVCDRPVNTPQELSELLR